MITIGKHELELKKYMFGEYLDIIEKSTDIMQDANDKEKITTKLNTRNLYLYTLLYSVKEWKIGGSIIQVTLDNLASLLEPSEGMNLWAECQKVNGLTGVELKNSLGGAAEPLITQLPNMKP